MDINNLIQTLVFMNLKDVSKMSYMELFPIVLFSLFFSYKEAILTFIKPYLNWNSYKSQIINEITRRVDKDGNLNVVSTSSVNYILWYYINNIEAIKSSSVVKEYRLRIRAEKDKDGLFLPDIYIPDVNTTVKLDTDVYLEFIHSSKTINTDKDTTTNEKVITLILKSKRLDSLTLKKWLDDISLSYSKWNRGDMKLFLYVSHTRDNKLDFTGYILNSTKTFDNLFFEQKEIIKENKIKGKSSL